MVGALVASVVLAWMTYRFIETPVREKAAGRYIPHLCGLAIIVFAAGFYVSKDGVRPYIDIPALNVILSAKDDWGFKESTIEIWRDDKLRVYQVAADRPEQVLYIGDSNMEQFLPRVTRIVREQPDKTYTATYITRGGCLPVSGVTRQDRPECHKIMDYARSYVRDNNVVRVVIAGIWAVMFDDDAELTYHFDDGRVVPFTQEEARNAVFQSISQMIHEFRSAGAEVTVIGTIPVYVDLMKGPTLDRLALLRVRRGMEELKIVPDFALEEGLNEEMAALIRDTARAAGAAYVDPTAFLCVDGRCPLYQDNHRGVYKDDTHITASYAREHATFMDKTILIGE